jgi:hypothetical protein
MDIHSPCAAAVGRGVARDATPDVAAVAARHYVCMRLYGSTIEASRSSFFVLGDIVLTMGFRDPHIM